MFAEQPEVTPRQVEMRRLAGSAREVIERLVNTEAPLDVLTRAGDLLASASAELDGWPQGRSFEGFAESANAGTPSAFFDHSPIIGKANPLAPPLAIEIREGAVHATVAFGSAYEGPPGSVHGGFIAAAFDEVLGMAQSLGGAPGMTGTLTIRYRRPTPLRTELRFEGTLDRTEGRKLFTSGRLFSPDGLCAEAEGLFIQVDFSRLVELMRAREGG